MGTWNGLSGITEQTDSTYPVPFSMTIHEDEQGTIWVSTYSSSVYYPENPVTGKAAHSNTNTRRITIINNYVNLIFLKTAIKTTVLVTEGGLSKYEPATGKFASYTCIQMVLPDNQFRMREDNNGVWISTAKVGFFQSANSTYTSVLLLMDC